MDTEILLDVKLELLACPPGDIPDGTLRAIIAQTGLRPEDLFRAFSIKLWSLATGLSACGVYVASTPVCLGALRRAEARAPERLQIY